MDLYRVFTYDGFSFSSESRVLMHFAVSQVEFLPCKIPAPFHPLMCPSLKPPIYLIT